ncbi:DUF4102 domain-containing protein [Citrobacter sp.]|uniref:DUF4102 domain-containing protein n=1 Tax=Citrobacter sp. TaxID=1896336 RepID=UPI003A8C637E
MAGKQEGKPLSFKAVKMMKPGGKDEADVGENRGLRLSCGATGMNSFFYRYASPRLVNLFRLKLVTFHDFSRLLIYAIPVHVMLTTLFSVKR